MDDNPKSAEQFLKEKALKRAVEDSDTIAALIAQLDLGISMGHSSSSIQIILNQLEAAINQLDANCAMLATILED